MKQKKLLIIGHVWPEPESSAAGSRMMQLIASFQQENYDIIFASACLKSERAFDLSQLGIVQATVEMNDSSFNHFVKGYKPDVVLFDRFMTEEQFGWRVSESCPEAVKILDTEDLHGLRKGRQEALKEGVEFRKTHLFNEVSKREIASIYRCDLTLMISEVEIELLVSTFKVPKELLFYLPFQCEPLTQQAIDALPGFEQRHHFITIGNFLHEPNYNGILYLKETLWPFIKKQLPNVELHIYGAYVSQKALQLNNEAEGFLIKGFAPNVQEVMSYARICLAPLRFGAGLKGKLIDAMQNGTPCVMTPIAAEGIFGNLESNGFVAASAQQFADQSVLLYQDEKLWREKQANGFVALRERFDKNLRHDALFSELDHLISNLEIHRQANFTGQLLQHHMLQSTKYMGKWIEEKNKK